MKQLVLPQLFRDLGKRTLIMGILNITPDSFYDGGRYNVIESAVEHARKMVGEGADLIDIGAESTRPGAEAISVEEEIKRLSPILKILLREINIPISLDTYKSTVAKFFLDQGGHIINDISGLRFDPKMAKVVAEYNIPIVLMHTSGKPKTMQANPLYGDIIRDITFSLKESIDMALASGIKKENIIIDPGIGFGKKSEDNLKIIKYLRDFQELNHPILIGVSRKSFIGHILDLSVENRLEGSLAALTISIMNGADIVRVHDVLASKRCVSLTDAVYRSLVTP